jgi:RNA polymerase sporulation-specific sigma factor
MLISDVSLPNSGKLAWRLWEELGWMAVCKVGISGINTSDLPLLKGEEKEELLRLALSGDVDARERYIKGNLRLVLSVVQRFAGNGENADDLFQIGCIGLIKAIDNFDMTLGVKFSTYAVPMIMGELRRHMRDYNSIRVSRSLRDTAYKAIHAKEQLMKANQKEPTIMEIATEVGIPKEEICMALDAIQTPMSLYEPVYSEGGDALFVMDQISDKKNVEENWVRSIAVQDAIDRLEDREREIVSLRFFDGKTQMEVAGEIGISQAQVSRLEKNALRSMRNYLA